MSGAEDKRERALEEKTAAAERDAKRGDNSKLIALLRELYRPHEIPDLWFIADLLEGKFNKRGKGRPAEGKIRAGARRLVNARIVDELMTSRGLTVEVAVEEAKTIIGMSETTIKGDYYYSKNAGLLNVGTDTGPEE